jgi:subtilisin family serine protease
MKKLGYFGALLLGAIACQDTTAPNPIVPSLTPTAASLAAAVANDYIITFRDDEQDPGGHARALAAAHGGRVTHVYQAALKGFAVADLPDAAVAALQRNPRIASIERDGVMSIDDAGVQTGATWGIDRIDQRDRPLDQTYNYDADGSAVTAYIIDTGIRSTHSQFGGRVSATGFTSINDGRGFQDCNGHGTHVAGTVGGSTYGVAQNVALVAVRVLSCSGSGTTSGVIAGVDWVSANAGAGSVANMSLGGSFSSTLNNAVNAAVDAGVTFVVAAGNSNANACNYSPASAGSAITVGATTSSDAKASYSNHGNCVDIHAPGSSITSAWYGSDTQTNTISGTSMASPHVAGAAAAYLELNPSALPAAVSSALNSFATTGRISGLPSGTVNLLLYVDFVGGDDGGGDPEPPPTSPTASFTKSCDGFVCTFTSTSTPAGLTHLWTFSEGGTSNATQVTRNYEPRTQYTVTLRVTNSANVSSQTTQSVNCNPRKCQ